MTTAPGLASIQVLDSRGEIASADFPFSYTVGTSTLANIISWVQGLGAAVDLVTDGQITKIRVSLLIPLPGGIKTSPNAGGDNEKTGLLTWDATATPNAYGTDIPAIMNSQLSGNQINLGAAAMSALVLYLETAATGIIGTDRYENALSSVRRGSLTFRKHRRALRRA